MLIGAIFHNFAHLSLLLAFFLALILGLFLFWRSAKRELLEEKLIFDCFIVFLAGSVLGRLTDFFIRPDYFQWSFVRLIFFNVFPGFDFYGAFLGGLLAVYFYLRSKKESFWDVFDLASSGFAFGLFFFKLMQLVVEKFVLKIKVDNFNMLLSILGYLFIFWAIKRFEKKKKHKGFFACFFIVLFAVLNSALLVFSKNLSKIQYWYTLAFMFSLGLIFAILWYIAAKRKIRADFKDFFASFLLFVFKTKRVLTNIREADTTARAIVLSPLYIAKSLYFLVKYIGRELYASVLDMLSAFGLIK